MRESGPEPDVSIVREDSYADHRPDSAYLVVEVAERSLEYDRETKPPLQAASCVDEYWIVDVAARAIEIHAAPDGARFTRVRRVVGSEAASPAAFPYVIVRVDALLPRARDVLALLPGSAPGRQPATGLSTRRAPPSPTNAS